MEMHMLTTRVHKTYLQLFNNQSVVDGDKQRIQ